MADQVYHRPGPLKQSNKSHKTGRHRSKSAIANALKGKVCSTTINHNHKHVQRKEQRRNQMNQLRINKREEILAIKRQLGGQNTAPFLVCLLPMHLQIDPRSALNILERCDDEAVVDSTSSGVTYIILPRYKQRFAFIIPPVGRGNEVVVLDYLKVCDTTLMLISAAMGEDEVFDKWGRRIYNMITAQTIPTPIMALMDLESLNPKHRSSAKIAVQKFISKLLPKETFMKLDTNSEGLKIMRRIGFQKKKIIHYRNNRPHLFGDHVEFIPNRDPTKDDGLLKVTGFLRGTSLNVNGLVHIAGLGDFQMSQIDAPQEPYKLDQSRNTEEQYVAPILAKADPNQQFSLQKENIPNTLNSEQVWPTEEEIGQSQQENKKIKLIKRVPTGYSAYQAAWIPDIEDVEDDRNEDRKLVDEENNDEDEFMSCKNNSDDREYDNTESDTEEYIDSATVSDAAINDEIYDLQMDFQEECETMKKLKEARIDEMWPDEVDTPLDIPARTRFQKFRGLESFRTSPWDPKEYLPSDYARIYQFKNFDRTKRHIINETKEVVGVTPGWYITIYVINVPAPKWNAFKTAQQTENVIVYGILPHEHQLSIMNVVLNRIPDSKMPIKSKEKLIIQCGYRRFMVNPIFSQHTNGDKHKFERYFRPHTTVCATFYAPIQFPPSPVLAFTRNPDTSLALVARGCLLSCNPNRIILKRVVLSGHPMRINRKSATVRYMFFNKEDVDYFKPVKLRTKSGRLGHIKDSLGTHGHMKCYFDGQLRSYDTVFMYLFKRVFPKWTYDDCLTTCEDHNQPQAMQV